MKKKAFVLGKRNAIDWAFFEKSLHQRFNVNAVTYKKNGQRRTSGDIEVVNEICFLIKKHPDGASRICDLVQQYMNHRAWAKKRYVTEECAAGMYKIVVPVIHENEVEGYISTCGRPFISTDRIYTHYIYETILEDETKIESLLPTLDPINPSTIKDIIYYITSYS
ncbi:PocR ligand-binding domain-containing protein [Thermodesulfobacteriota bacterium]